MTEKKNSIRRAIERLILRLSKMEINSLGKIVKKLKKSKGE
jgi:hypothetical protein